jgi:hypothetical protein
VGVFKPYSMRRTNVTIGLTNGGLNISPPSEFGTSALIVSTPAAPTSGYNIPFLIKSQTDADKAFTLEANVDILAAIKEGFYGEAPAGTKLYIVCKPAVTTLTQMAAPANADPVLLLAKGQVRLLAIGKLPSPDLLPLIDQGFDSDVHTAVNSAQTLANNWFIKKQPFRFFIQGAAYSGNADEAKDYQESNFRNGHIIVGTVKTNDSAGELFALLLALGRAAKVSPGQNIGRVKTGSLSIDDSYTLKLGAVQVDNVPDSDLDTLYEKQYITFEKNVIAPGYLFNDDNSLVSSTDDFNNLRNGRVIDNAVRIAFATYYRELKDDVDVVEGGRLSSVVEKALETEIETAIDQQIGSQLSTNTDGRADVVCMVNPDPTTFTALYAANNIDNPNLNLFQNGDVYLFVSMRPKGCIKHINVFLGFTA